MDTIIERILDFHVCRTCLTENNCRDLYESNIVNMINECNFITVSCRLFCKYFMYYIVIF